MSKTKNRGGSGRGQGRHKKDCTCEKCLLKKDLEQVAREEEKTIVNDPADQIDEHDDTTIQNPPDGSKSENPPVDDKTQQPNSGDQPKKKSIDFSRYKSASKPTGDAGGDTGDKTGESKQEPKQGKGKAPKAPPVVVIKGTVLLAIINFVAPMLFVYIGKVVKGDFIAEDFRLKPTGMTDLVPAADAVADQYFKNLSPLAQLLIGYSSMSWTNAMFVSSMRKKEDKKGADKK